MTCRFADRKKNTL